MGSQDNEEKMRREALRRFVLHRSEISLRYQPTSIICRKLVEVTTKLGPLSEQNGVLKLQGNADHVSILNGFVQDLVCAVTDYCIGTTEPAVIGHRQVCRPHPATAVTSHPRNFQVVRLTGSCQ
jgi:hypothetical protein